MGQSGSKATTDIFELNGRDGELYASTQPDTVFHIKGANWFGSETFSGPPGGLDKHNVAWYLDFLKKHNFNAIRVLFAHEFVEQDGIVKAPTQEPLLFQVRYVQMLRILAREAAQSFEG